MTVSHQPQLTSNLFFAIELGMGTVSSPTKYTRPGSSPVVPCACFLYSNDFHISPHLNHHLLHEVFSKAVLPSKCRFGEPFIYYDIICCSSTMEIINWIVIFSHSPILSTTQLYQNHLTIKMINHLWSTIQFLF